jgi:hypothetical protein
MSLFSDNNLVLSKQKGGKNEDYTPLIKAIKDRNVDEVERLLESGTSPNETDSVYGWTPLTWASFVYDYAPDRRNHDNINKMTLIFEALVSHNARPNQDFIDDDGGYDFDSFITDHPDIMDRIFPSGRSNTTNTHGTSGGKRVRKSKKSKKSRKSKKSKKSRKSRK